MGYQSCKFFRQQITLAPRVLAILLSLKKITSCLLTPHRTRVTASVKAKCYRLREKLRNIFLFRLTPPWQVLFGQKIIAFQFRILRPRVVKIVFGMEDRLDRNPRWNNQDPQTLVSNNLFCDYVIWLVFLLQSEAYRLFWLF